MNILYILLLQIKFLNSVIVDLKSKNASLQDQLDTLMLSPDDADLYDLDVNGELTLVTLFFTYLKLSVYAMSLIKYRLIPSEILMNKFTSHTACKIFCLNVLKHNESI